MKAFVEQTAQISNKKAATEILEVMIVDCLESQKQPVQQSAEFSDFSHARGKEMMHSYLLVASELLFVHDRGSAI
jgi:hypothetical protein